VTVDIVPILSTIVLIATLATLILGVVSYAVFRLRERRAPRPDGGSAAGKQFFVRYHDHGGSEDDPQHSVG
jgi:hypothetical protein